MSLERGQAGMEVAGLEMEWGTGRQWLCVGHGQGTAGPSSQ